MSAALRADTPLTPTQLRSNIYRVLDEVLESGMAREIIRNGQKLLIIPAKPKRRRLAELPRRRMTNCTFDELVATTWEWEPEA